MDTIPFAEEEHWTPQDADKEYLRNYIRERVRKSRVGDNVIFIPANPTPSMNDPKEMRVAVYARVSTKSTEQVSSIENQTKYYTEKVEKTPNWSLFKIYSDEGKSGTSTKKRTEFRRMLKDASEGKFDLILCASVSRFAREVSTAVEEVKRLRYTDPHHPIGVYFETENIYTLEPDYKQAFNIHAMLAEWESDTKSRRMILSYDQRICTGQYQVVDLFGYRHTRDGDLIIKPDEAKTVRFIYLAYIFGYSCAEIAEILTEKNRRTPNGKSDWTAGKVWSIMGNERRHGDLHARKTVVLDYSKQIVVKNNKIRDSAYVPGHHKGIVSPEIAKAVKLVSQSGSSVNGVPETAVITKGILKGFISICPAWQGVSIDMLENICSEYYTEDDMEYDDETCIDMPSGAFFICGSTPTLSVTKSRISFNSACRDRFDSDYVELLYHPFLDMLAVRGCSGNEPNAIYINKLHSLTGRGFAGIIYEKLGIQGSPKCRFKGITRSRGNENILFFMMNEVQLVSGGRRDMRSSVPMPQKSASITVIRDRLLKDISESDILERKTVIDNPMIGHIPCKSEVIDELDSLLLSM